MKFSPLCECLFLVCFTFSFISLKFLQNSKYVNNVWQQNYYWIYILGFQAISVQYRTTMIAIAIFKNKSTPSKYSWFDSPTSLFSSHLCRYCTEHLFTFLSFLHNGWKMLFLADNFVAIFLHVRAQDTTKLDSPKRRIMSGILNLGWKCQET